MSLEASDISSCDLEIKALTDGAYIKHYLTL